MAGKVKSEKAVKTDFAYDESNSEWVENNSYTISYNEFDEHGNLLIEKSFNSVGEFHEYNEFKYDEKGFMIEKLIYLDEDEIAERLTYFNDQNGKPVKKTTCYQESSEDYTEYKYNENGKIIEKLRKDEDGYVEECEKAVYEGENLISEVRNGLDNELIQTNKFTYDESGRIVSASYQDYVAGDITRIDYIYNENGSKSKSLTYDSSDRLISKTVYEYDDKERVIEIVEEDTASYKLIKLNYDEAGNVVLQEEFDRENNLVLSIDRTFNPEGVITKSAVFAEGHDSVIAQYYEVDYEYELFK